MQKITFLITLLIILTMPVTAIESGNSTDDFGIILSRNNAGFLGTTNIYNPLGDIIGKVSVNTIRSSKVYDADGNIIKTYKKSKDRITCYDANDQVLGIYLIDERYNTTHYNNQGEIIGSYKYDSATQTVTSYSPNGYMTGRYTTDINGKTRKYDQYGNITQLYYSEGLQSVNINEGFNGVLNSIFDKCLRK